MSRAKKNRSTEIKRTDGRKNNKRLAPKPISTIKSYNLRGKIKPRENAYLLMRLVL